MRTPLFALGGRTASTTGIVVLAAVSGLIALKSSTPFAIWATLAVLVAAPLVLLLAFERRRRHRAECAESGLQSALAAAIIEAARLKQSTGPTTPSRDQVDAGTPASDPTAPPTRRATAAHASARHVSAVRQVIGYVSVSDDPHSDTTQTSLDAVHAACGRAGWKLLEIVRDRENGRILERPGLHYALERIADAKANVLVVAEMRRLSRSIVDLGALMAWFRESGAALIALDLDIDTSTREGYQVATTLVALSNWERERIASRTRSALAEVRAHGHPTGRPAVSDRPDLLERISAMRAANLTLRAIADQLNAEQIPTLRGGREWRPSSIQAALGYRRPGPRDHLPSPQKSKRG
jgi:DNA invertase Pin-like site-specific DNA recombinase